MLKIDNIISKISVKEEKHSAFKSTFVMEPLYRGYGHTIGNSIRRILLSSMAGCAIKGVKIDGVVSEFATIEGVKENIVDILLNIKSIVVAAKNPDEKTLSIEVKGPKVVTAADIKHSADIEVINKEQVIAEITNDATLKIEMMADVGRGFVPAEDLDKSDWPVGFLAIDAIYSPVKSVDYQVEDTMLGRFTNFDKLIINLETSGSIEPKELISYAVDLYISHLKPLLDIGNAMTHLRPVEIVEDTVSESASVPQMRIEDLDLSVRSYNCLKKSDINTLEDLVKLSQKELIAIKNLGKSSITEINAKLEELGVKS